MFIKAIVLFVEQSDEEKEYYRLKETLGLDNVPTFNSKQKEKVTYFNTRFCNYILPLEEEGNLIVIQFFLHDGKSIIGKVEKDDFNKFLKAFELL